MNFIQEDQVFEQLKSALSDTIKSEYEGVFNELIKQYNTAIHENRFLVGGALKVFTYALLRSVGIDCTLDRPQPNITTIKLSGKGRLLIKGSLQGGARDVTLINTQGDSSREWKTATLFVISGVGIVYGSPDMVDKKYIENKGGEIKLKKEGLEEIINTQENVIEMELSTKPSTKDAAGKDLVSEVIAKKIMKDREAKDLLKALK